MSTDSGWPKSPNSEHSCSTHQPGRVSRCKSLANQNRSLSFTFSFPFHIRHPSSPSLTDSFTSLLSLCVIYFFFDVRLKILNQPNLFAVQATHSSHLKNRKSERARNNSFSGHAPDQNTRISVENHRAKPSYLKVFENHSLFTKFKVFIKEFLPSTIENTGIY